MTQAKKPPTKRRPRAKKAPKMTLEKKIKAISLAEQENINIIGNASSTLLPWNRKGFIIKRHKIFRLKSNPTYKGLDSV